MNTHLTTAIRYMMGLADTVQDAANRQASTGKQSGNITVEQMLSVASEAEQQSLQRLNDTIDTLSATNFGSTRTPELIHLRDEIYTTLRNRYAQSQIPESTNV